MEFLLEDTRNKLTPKDDHKNIHDYCSANGIEIIRTKLLVGDYTLPTDQRICIDTKQSMTEVYSNLTEYQRFHDEYELAQKVKITLIVLVEDPSVHNLDEIESWVNPLKLLYDKGKRPKPPRPSDVLMRQMKTIAREHGVIWKFCDKSETGQLIEDILTRQL